MNDLKQEVRVQCRTCEMKQAPNDICRRCGRPLMGQRIIVRYLPLTKSEELPTLAEAEENLIRAALERTGGDLMKAAAILGIGKTTIYRKTEMRQRKPRRRIDA